MEPWVCAERDKRKVAAVTGMVMAPVIYTFTHHGLIPPCILAVLGTDVELWPTRLCSRFNSCTDCSPKTQSVVRSDSSIKRHIHLKQPPPQKKQVVVCQSSTHCHLSEGLPELCTSSIHSKMQLLLFFFFFVF